MPTNNTLASTRNATGLNTLVSSQNPTARLGSEEDEFVMTLRPTEIEHNAPKLKKHVSPFAS